MLLLFEEAHWSNKWINLTQSNKARHGEVNRRPFNWFVNQTFVRFFNCKFLNSLKVFCWLILPVP